MNLYKKPLSSSQYCHTEEEAVTNIHKVFYQKRLYLIYLKAFLIRAAVSASTSCVTSIFFPPKYISDSFWIGIK